MENKRKEKLWIALGLAAFIGLLVLFIFSGNNFDLLKGVFLGTLPPEALDAFSWQDYLTVIVLATLQVICTFLPAEPVQVLAGISFGFWEGLLCCMTGVFIGNTCIYLLQRIFGDRLRGYFVKKLRLDLEKIAKSRQCVFLVFALYFLPAIPYGMICFFAASIGMKYRRYLTVTLLGALPSVCIGVGLGYMALVSGWIAAVCIFAVLIILLVILTLRRDVLFARLNQYTEKQPIPKTNGPLLAVLYYVLLWYYRLCGVRVKAVNKAGRPEKPAIILCNHGSFIDFIFAATLIRKVKPKFVAARLYFYDRRLGWLIRKIGGFPKSMFALDTESTKNCLRVLRNNDILGMMPEARLSTTGRFEDIQESTFSFIKKAGVPVYTVKFGGDYFADPKWGKGFRRGAVVEAELDILFTGEEVNSLSVDEIKARILQRLDYNEFEWLKARPHLHYRSKRMAEGLENILTHCPLCGEKHTITTQKDKVFCEHCGYLTSLDDRYQFTGDFRFADLTQWYDWQKGLFRAEIAANPDFTLTSAVELRLPSKGRGLTRHGGYGVCTLSRSGLTYRGTKDGVETELCFPIRTIYRLLFGAGENFEIYNGTEILYFVPEEKRSSVDWYIVSALLYDSFS